MRSGERTRKEKKGRGGRASESEEETRTKRPESGVKRPREPVAKMAGLSMEEKLEKGKQNPASGLERSAEWGHGYRTVLVQTYMGPDIRKISLSLNLH